MNNSYKILILISLALVSEGPVGNKPSWVQVMAWCRMDNQPLQEAMMIQPCDAIWVTRQQWDNGGNKNIADPLKLKTKGKVALCKTVFSPLHFPVLQQVSNILGWSVQYCTIFWSRSLLQWLLSTLYMLKPIRLTVQLTAFSASRDEKIISLMTSLCEL